MQRTDSLRAMMLASEALAEASIDMATAIHQLGQANEEHPSPLGKVCAAQAQAAVQACMRRMVEANRALDAALLEWDPLSRPRLELVR